MMPLAKNINDAPYFQKQEILPLSPPFFIKEKKFEDLAYALKKANKNITNLAI